MTKDEILLAHQECLFPAVFHYFSEPLVLTRAKDQFVFDVDGRQYLDFFGGIVTVSVGHCNDKVSAAIHAQADKLVHTSTLFANEPLAALAKKITSIAPGSRMEVLLYDERHRGERDRDSRRALLHGIV